MAKRFSIESVFKAIDRVTGPMRGMARNVNKFTRKMQRGFRNLNRSTDKLGRALKTVSIVAVGSLTLISVAMADVIGTGAEFEQTLVNAAVKFPEGIRRGTDAFRELEDVARQVGTTTEFTATQAAEGLNFLAFAGFNAKQSMAALPGIVDLATAAELDLGTASDIATDSLGAFGLATKDAVQQAKNLNRVVDVLALTSTSTNTDIVTMFESIKKGGATFTGAGQSIESFAALAGIMANAGLKGGESGLVLKNTMLRLSSATGPATTLLRKMNINLADSEGNFRDVLDILVDFEAGLKGMGNVQRSNALNTIFGTRAITGLNIALKSGSTSIREFRGKLKNASGTASEMAGVMRDTLQGRLNALTSVFEGLKISLLKLKQVGLEGTIEGLIDFIRVVNSTINANKELAGELGTGIFKVMKGIAGVIAILLVQFVFLKAAIISNFIVTSVWSAALFVLNGLFVTLKVVLGAAKLAMVAFNIVANLNPIGAIVIAVAALIGLGFLLINNWDLIVAKIKSAASIIGKVLGAVFAPFTNIIGGLGSIFTGASGLLFGSEEGKAGKAGADGAPQMVTPQDRIAQNIEERRETSTATLTINGDTSGAELKQTNKTPGIGMTLAESGAF